MNLLLPPSLFDREEAMSVSKPPPARLLSAESALGVIGAALASDQHAGTIVLVDRRPPANGLVIPVVDDRNGECVDRLDALVLDALNAEPDCRMVIAARRRAGMTMVDEDDLDLWRRLRARHAATNVHLLDLFVLSGDAIFSMADLTGSPARWDADDLEG